MKPFEYVAYSSLRDDLGAINTAEHFRHVGTLPFDYIKGDIRPTADGGIIMCHDGAFTLDENGRITKPDKNNCKRILEMTTEECLRLEYGIPYGGKYCRVTDFETYISICKQSGIPPYVTVRDEEIETVAPIVLDVLEKYGLIESAIINSFTLETLKIFRRLCSESALSYVRAFRKPLERADIENALRLQNCLVCGFHYRWNSLDQTEGKALMQASVDALSYAASKGVKVWQAIVYDESVIAELQAFGFSGAQVRYIPSISQRKA